MCSLAPGYTQFLIAIFFFQHIHTHTHTITCICAIPRSHQTVSVLGVLNAKRVNPHLFSLVFGESALNDAVAIVLFESFSHLVELSDSASNYQMEDTSSMLKEIGTFVGTFVVDIVGCPIMGIVFASLSALVFKYITFDGTPILELTLYMLIMYIPFIVAEILGMSGIVTIFFTGIFARRYVEPNVTDATKHNAEVIFNLVAYLAETCIFINLGLSVFGFSGQFHWSFISCAFIASLIGRAMAIYPISFLNNISLREYMNRPFSCTGRSGSSTAVNRRATIDVATAQTIATLNNNDDSNNNDNTNSFMMMQSSIAMAAPQSNRVGEAAFASNGDANNNSSTRSSVTKDGYSIEPMDVDEYSINSIGMIVLRTPEQSRDKIIPVKFMHFLWFAGLRGAVAYAVRFIFLLNLLDDPSYFLGVLSVSLFLPLCYRLQYQTKRINKYIHICIYNMTMTMIVRERFSKYVWKP